VTLSFLGLVEKIKKSPQCQKENNVKKANKKAKQKNMPQNLYVKYDFLSPIQSNFYLYFL